MIPRRLTLQRLAPCPTCSGSGAARRIPRRPISEERGEVLPLWSGWTLMWACVARARRRAVLTILALTAVCTWLQHRTGPVDLPACERDSPREGTPLVVMATTMGHTKNEFKRQVQRNVLRGYLAQTPTTAVLPLVFTDSEALAAMVRAETAPANRAHGLDTVTDAFEQDHGWPVFASMMKKAEATAVEIGAPFYGYANGDILFTQDLTVTLQFVSEAIDRSFFASPPPFAGGHSNKTCEPVCPSLSTRRKRPKLLQRGMMIIGRRTNVPFADFASHFSHADSCELSKDLLQMAKDGEPMNAGACDYFIFVPGSFDWGTRLCVC